jgi:HEPN domain-containing protein
MSERDRILIVAQEWVEKAEHDLTAAAFTLRMGADCPTDTVCFHAQQCVEKYLKAALVWQGTPFPKTHDVWEILLLLPEAIRPALAPEEARRLTEYATVTRYPGDYEPITLAEARRAVSLARRIRAAMRKNLPGKALKPRRR